MINDKEINKLSQDRLNFKAYVQTLEEIVLKSETPLTIGVYGEWGTGKTSLMKMTESSLKASKKIQSIWFDAWKYDKVEDLRVALIFSIIKQIEQDVSSSKKLKEKASDFLKRINWLNLAKNVSKIGLSLATPYLANMAEMGNLLTDKQVQPKLDLSKLLSDDLINSVSIESLNFLHEFEELYKGIIKQYIGKDGKLIVFIDDLDRCLPDKAIDILEAIKLFLSIDGSMFIIGVDHDVVMEGVKIKYPIKELSENGWANNYLEKIIQLPFRLPPLRKDTIAENFVASITSQKGAFAELASIFSEVGGNPRTVKRVVNNFELQKTLSRKRVLNIDEKIIAKFIVLDFRWPDFYKDFLNLYNTNGINLISQLQSTSENLNLSITNKYTEDSSLLNFLKKEPDFTSNIPNLDNYIHLARTNTQTKEEFKETLDLGKTNIELRKPEKAISVLSDAILINEKETEPYFYRAIAYLMKNDIESYELDIAKWNPNFKYEIV